MAISQAGGYAAVFVTLVVIAMSALGILKTDVARHFDRDAYFAARNSQSPLRLALSYFVTGIGGWVVFTVPLIGATAGSLGVAGYALSAIVPLLILSFIAPFMRRKLPRGVTFADYVLKRFGPAVSNYVTVISMVYMFCLLSGEYTAVNGAASFLLGINGIVAAVGTAVITLVYTAVGGLPVSLLTDQIQGIAVLFVGVIIAIGVLAYVPIPEGQIGASGAADATIDGFATAVILIIAVTSAELLNAGSWQRIWAAEDNAAMVKGVGIACVLILLMLVLYGVIGMAALAYYGPALFVPDFVAHLSALFFVQEMGEGWVVTTAVAVVAMVASSADSVQNAMAALLSTHEKVTLPRAQALTVVLNIPAVVVGSLGIDVFTLLIIADLFAAATVVPIGLGLWERTHPNAALAGCVSALLSVLLIFIVGGSIETGSVEAGLAMIVWYSPASRTWLAAFLLPPVIGGLVAVVGSLATKYKFEGYGEEDVKPSAA